ncbi:MAG: hypothetical protein HKP30_05060 [Myxococcales bacterium]|nr:hypothetical protein [Myxococcales bacterium]
MSQPSYDAPTPDLPEPIGLGPSPFWPQHLIDLFIRPTRFFSGQLALGRTPYALFVTWIVGISAAIDRIDTRLLQAELRDDPARWEAIELLLATWPRFWGLALAAGVVGGAAYWWIGGWWCRVRLRWSGAEAPDPRLARLLLIYSSFVFAAPVVLTAAYQTTAHPNYLAAYESDSLLPVAVLMMIFWSIATTYRGALALFAVSRARARIWFVALPLLFYFVLVGGFATLFTILASDPGGAR